MTERLGTGLQNQARGFESRLHLVTEDSSFDNVGLLAGGDLDYVLAGGKVYLSADGLSAFLLRKGTELGFTALMSGNPYTGAAGYAMLALSKATENLSEEIIRVEVEAILSAPTPDEPEKETE